MHRLDEVQPKLLQLIRQGKGLMGKHPLIMGCVRGLVELCKTYYGVFSGRTKDKEREEQA